MVDILELSRGVVAGDFASAYENTDIESFGINEDGTPTEEFVEINFPESGTRDAIESFVVGFILGFYNSFELTEIPTTLLSLFEQAYYSPEGDVAVDRQYVVTRTAEDWAEVF